MAAAQHIEIAVMSRQNEALLEKVILIRGRVRKMIIEAFPNLEIYHNAKKQPFFHPIDSDNSSNEHQISRFQSKYRSDI